jgi:hypothetical protein
MKVYTFNASDGIINLKSLIFRTKRVVSALQSGLNIKIRDDGQWCLREGRGAKKYTGATHSVDPKNSGLFMDGSTLRRVTSVLTTPYTTVEIATMSNDEHMVYESIPGRGIVVSNGTDIGIVLNDVYTPFTDPSEQYKRKMPGGQILAWHGNVLYVARGSYIYHSDPESPGIIDYRNEKEELEGYISLMVPVDDGMYISDSYDTLFYHGATPHDMVSKVVADYPAIYGMNVTVERQFTLDGTTQGTIAYWMSSKGVCMGTKGGEFVNRTIQKYSLSSIPQKGTAFFRNNNGIPQFIGVGII